MHIRPNMNHIKPLFDPFSRIFAGSSEYSGLLAVCVGDIEDLLDCVGQDGVFDAVG